jgi:hypothetical protein
MFVKNVFVFVRSLMCTVQGVTLKRKHNDKNDNIFSEAARPLPGNMSGILRV